MPKRADATQAVGTKLDARAVDEELAMTHAIVGTSGELVGVMLVSRNLAQLSRVQLLAHSRKLVALKPVRLRIAHEEEPLNAMMIHLELLVDQDPRHVCSGAAARTGGGRRRMLGQLRARQSAASTCPRRARTRLHYRE